MNVVTPAHGILALSPRAGQLVAARALFDNPQASDTDKVGAAKIMAEIGTAFDAGRARRWIRDQLAASAIPESHPIPLAGSAPRR